ncbi:MAG TPA: alpha/beta hydrolase [Cytophagaceae bacterium]|jgi:pimeloyl-ACP methyl ester carboxylesterase
MNYIQTTDKNTGEAIQLYYEISGSGQPVVFLHGWPLSHEMWEYQINELAEKGLKCIAYDRRGFGKSSKPWSGYDYDTLTDDLKALLDELNLENVVLVGFSMGGGEVLRYMSRYGSTRISKIVLISSVAPFLLKTTDNPDGVEKEVFEGITKSIKKDRIDFLTTFGEQFFGVSFIKHPVSSSYLEYNKMLASLASPRATLECAKSFSETDFRDDLKNVSVPTLIIHGDSDKTVPIEASSNRTAKTLSGHQYIVYEGAPHGLYYTDRDRLNQDLIQFIKGENADIHSPDRSKSFSI